jgi:hypothetical protein
MKGREAKASEDGLRRSGNEDSVVWVIDRLLSRQISSKPSNNLLTHSVCHTIS